MNTTLEPAAQRAVSAFLQQLGFDGFEWDGLAVELAYESGGQLKIENLPRGLMLARVTEIQEYEIEDLAPRAMRLVHYDQRLPFTVQTGLSGHNKLMFLIALRANRVAISTLSQALEVLDLVHRKLRQQG